MTNIGRASAQAVTVCASILEVRTQTGKKHVCKCPARRPNTNWQEACMQVSSTKRNMWPNTKRPTTGKKLASNVKYLASPKGASYSHAVHLTMHSSLATDLQQRLAACKGASVVYCLRSSCSTYSQRYDRISHSTWVFLDPEYVGPTLDRLDRGMQLELNGKYFRQSHHANLPIDQSHHANLPHAGRNSFLKCAA